MRKLMLAGLALALVWLLVPAAPGIARAEEEELRLSLSVAGKPKPDRHKKGDTFEVEVAAGQAKDLFGVQFVVEYDPKALQLKADGHISVSKRFNDWVRKADARKGKVELALTRKTLPSGATGTESLATLKFKALKEGETTIRLTGIKATDAAPRELAANDEFVLRHVIDKPGKPDKPDKPDKAEKTGKR